jgi:hypothetical protein
MPATLLSVSAAFALLLFALTSPATAATCAAQPVSARGDPSGFEVLAKAKARGNWRAKVRAMPTLGATYADFNKAQGADYSCTQQDGQHLCTAFGRPCRD